MALAVEPTYKGLFSTAGTNAVNQEQRKVDIPDEIFYLEQDDTPLIYLARGAGKNMPKGHVIKQRPSINPEFKVLTKNPHGSWNAMGTGV